MTGFFLILPGIAIGFILGIKYQKIKTWVKGLFTKG